MARSVAVWIAKTDDAAIPERVQLRVWERSGGHCQICTRKILTGEVKHFDHVVPLADGGKHCESNLQVACVDCHGKKTAAENHERAQVRRKAKAVLGIKRPAGKIKSPGFPATEKPAAKSSKPPLPPRILFKARTA